MMMRMTKMKILSVVASALLAVAGFVLLVFAAMATEKRYEVNIFEPHLIWMMMAALASICFSCLAAYGAYREEPRLLAGLVAVMLTSSVVMVMTGSIMTVMSTLQLQSLRTMNVERLSSDAMNNDRLQQVLHTIEKESQCCGVKGYTDYTRYDGTIPSSCQCSNRGKGCVSSLSSSSSSYGSRYPYDRNPTNQRKEEAVWVYEQPCGEILLKYLQEDVRRADRASSALPAVVLMSFLLCCALLLQMGSSAAPPAGQRGAAPGPHVALHMSPAPPLLSPASPAWP
ncbi:CD63 antigen-like [Myripristis murdjan]|uniref:CD63 antigen-like n=1 Tax=Myripristis murdjan TaxID=586833 RepID=UPI001175D8C2|nr:CD63 antigen-like [Myripristis murdjan]